MNSTLISDYVASSSSKYHGCCFISAIVSLATGSGVNNPHIKSFKLLENNSLVRYVLKYVYQNFSLLFLWKYLYKSSLSVVLVWTGKVLETIKNKIIPKAKLSTANP